MAGIDKTYGTVEQSRALYRWLKKHRPKFLRYHYGYGVTYAVDASGEIPILNTSAHADKWMARHCPFEFVLRRIVEVYHEGAVARRYAERRLAGRGA